MLDLLNDYCNCFLLSLIKKHLNEHITNYNFSFLIEKGFAIEKTNQVYYLILFISFAFIFILKQIFYLPKKLQ